MMWRLDETLSFQLIQPYFSKLETLMPRAATVFEGDNENCLLRIFVFLALLATAPRTFNPVPSKTVLMCSACSTLSVT
jgi:hypothetical protein